MCFIVFAYQLLLTFQDHSSYAAKLLITCELSKYFRNVFGELLRFYWGSEDGNIAEISYSVGYKKPQYFATVFKSHFGLTPKEYRKRAYIAATQK